MSFQPIAHFEQLENDKKKKESKIEAFLSVNYNGGGYLGGLLYDLLDRPRFLVVEYDTVTNTLRFKPQTAYIALRVKNRAFKLPETIRHAMGKKPTAGKATVRYSVEKANDGWWYTSPIKDEVKG